MWIIIERLRTDVKGKEGDLEPLLVGQVVVHPQRLQLCSVVVLFIFQGTTKSYRATTVVIYSLGGSRVRMP